MRCGRAGAVGRVWVWTVLGLGCAACAGFESVAAQSDSPQQRQSKAWNVPEVMTREEPEAIKPFWSKRLTGYLATREGVNLRYSVLLPEGTGPFPVIMNYSGYDPGAIGGTSYLHNNTAMARSIDRTFLEHGYAVLGVNARGTGCSEGVFDFLGRNYGTDGADAVEWAARQSWSNGAIAMANWSWAGMSQVATASERPPHLKAIAPGMVLTDPRLDSWALGGVPSGQFVTGWWMFLHSRWVAVKKSAEAEHDERCLVQVDRNYETGETREVNLPSLLLRHPLRDDWIDARTILNRAHLIKIPVLSMEAFQDEATTARGGYYQDQLDPSRLWMVQTNGNHDLYESLRFRETLLAFLDHFVKDVPNGLEKRPHVEIWEETTTKPSESAHSRDENATPSWVIQKAAFPVPTQVTAYLLSEEGALLPDGPPRGQPDHYTYPVAGPTVDAGFGTAEWGPMNPAWRQGSLSYTSAPLPGDLVAYGPASADLWVSSTASDTDLQVTLTEIRPDGQELFVQRGWLRVSDRALDTALSTPVRPVLRDTPDAIEALTPGVPVLSRVELTKFSYPFRKGSCIRIWIDAPSATGGNGFDYSSTSGTNMIWHDAEHPSRLAFGVLPEAKVQTLAPSFGAVLMPPCRTDPPRPRPTCSTRGRPPAETRRNPPAVG